MTAAFGRNWGRGEGYATFQYIIDFKWLINEINCIFCGIFGVFVTLVSPSGGMSKLIAALLCASEG
jgi:hypothetical protein